MQKYICMFLSRKVLPHMSIRAKKDWLTPGEIVNPKIAKLAVDPLTENQLITGTALTLHQDALAYNHNCMLSIVWIKCWTRAAFI